MPIYNFDYEYLYLSISKNKIVERGQPFKWISITSRRLVSAVVRGGYIWFTKKNYKI
jgi:hypothetical protein